jgi:hypothetical protein
MIMGTRYPAPRGLDGKRRTATATYRGTKRQAEARLGELMNAVDRGAHAEPSKLTIATFVGERIALWRSEGRIGARSQEAHLAVSS